MATKQLLYVSTMGTTTPDNFLDKLDKGMRPSDRWILCTKESCMLILIHTHNTTRTNLNTNKSLLRIGVSILALAGMDSEEQCLGASVCRRQANTQYH